MAARFCPQCGREISSASRFCTHCGATLTPQSAGAPLQPAPTRVDTAAQGTRRLLLPLGIGALVVLAIAVAVLASRLHQESLLNSHPISIAAAPLTNAPIQPIAPAPAITNAPTQPIAPAPPLTNAPTTGPGQLPPAVAAYVQFLKGIEQQRVALSNNIGGAQAMLGIAHQMQSAQQDPNATPQSANNSMSQLSQGFASYNNKWEALISDFRSQTPPPECSNLANQYWLFLAGYPKVTSELQVAILNHSLGAAMQAQSAQSEINQQGLQADSALAQLCAHYNAPKPFSIQPDGSSSSLLGA